MAPMLLVAHCSVFRIAAPARTKENSMGDLEDAVGTKTPNASKWLQNILAGAIPQEKFNRVP